MLRANISDTICNLREFICPRQIWQPGFNKAVLFRVGAELGYWFGKDDDSGDWKYVNRGIQVILSGNTNVFISTYGDKFHNRVGRSYNPSCTFFNAGNHDSCWRESVRTELSKIYFELAEKLNPDVAPASLTDHSTIYSFEVVEIEHVKDPTDIYGYRRELKFIQTLKTKEMSREAAH